MIETIEQYQKNKEMILEEVGKDVLSPDGIAAIIDVPTINELEKLKELNSIDDFDDPFLVEKTTTIGQMEAYGASKLFFIFYHRPKMLHIFMMKNKSFRVRQSELMLGGMSKCITNNLLFVFEKFKIEELRDREGWVPIDNRWEILDL